MASIGSEDGDIGFQIAPMVDVVFVLMLFFMASAGTQVVEKELTVKLPAGPGTSQAQITPIIIEISAEGAVAINNETYGAADDKGLERLKAWLAAAMETSEKDPVIIRPAPEAKHNRVIEVLNACAKAKIKNLTFS